jgi:hypothetical protein
MECDSTAGAQCCHNTPGKTGPFGAWVNDQGFNQRGECCCYAT